MVLKDEAAINAALVPASTDVTTGALATSQAIDNEVCRAGLVRKIRRLILQNLENAVVTVSIDTQDAAGANDALLVGGLYQLTNFQTLILEPEREKESLHNILSTGNVRRFSAHIPAGALPTGVRVKPWYYDDLEA